MAASRESARGSLAKSNAVKASVQAVQIGIGADDAAQDDEIHNRGRLVGILRAPSRDGIGLGLARFLSYFFNSLLEIPTSHQCVNVTLHGTLFHSVFPHHLANKLVVGLEGGKLLVGKFAPLATDGVQHVVAFDVLRA